MLLGLWLVVAILVRGGVPVPDREGLLRRVADKAGRLVLPLRALVGSPAHGAGVVVTSLLSWAMAIGIVQTLFEATGADVPALGTVALWPLAVFAGMFPLTVAGMGTRDAAFVYALGLSGHSVDEGGGARGHPEL